jgi:ssDNA-specific exonuclease RecJ
MLTMHIANHTAAQEAEVENEVVRLNEHLKWTPQFAMEIVGIAERLGLVRQREGLLTLTESGLKRASQEFNA